MLCQMCACESVNDLCAECTLQLEQEYAQECAEYAAPFFDLEREVEFEFCGVRFWFDGTDLDEGMVPATIDSVTTVDDMGRVIFLTHGSEDGALLVTPPAGVDLVVCCYPKQCQARNPHLNIVGDWDCPTMTFVEDGCLKVAVAPEIEGLF